MRFRLPEKYFQLLFATFACKSFILIFSKDEEKIAHSLSFKNEMRKIKKAKGGIKKTFSDRGSESAVGDFFSRTFFSEEKNR